MVIVHDTVLSLEDHRALMNGFSGTLVKPVEDSDWTTYGGATLSFAEDAYTALDISSSSNGTANITLSGYADENINVSESVSGNELTIYITHTPAASYSDSSIEYELSTSGYVNNLALSSNNVNAVASLEDGVVTIDTGSVVSGTEYYYNVALFATG
jgi:HSP20 family molecular chaperone IbpA